MAILLLSIIKIICIFGKNVEPQKYNHKSVCMSQTKLKHFWFGDKNTHCPFQYGLETATLEPVEVLSYTEKIM